jgi:hypothetical protein
MKRNQGDSPANRDGGTGKTTPDSSEDVAWMTNAGLDDCKITAARAPLWALVEAHRILLQRANNKTRSKVVRGAMKRRFNVVMGSDEELSAVRIGKKGGNES